MGAFFLHKSGVDIDQEAVQEVFRRKGFSNEPFRTCLGEWELVLYKKQVVEEKNYIHNENEASVYCTGTVIYKGLDYEPSLKSLLSDFRSGEIEHDKLLGNFCIIFWNGKWITFLNDHLNVYHIFVNMQCSCISSSFLAVLASSTEKLNINRMAFLEKLATGYILSPDTLIDGIYQVDSSMRNSFSSLCPGAQWITDSRPGAPVYDLHSNGFKKSIDTQIEALRSYFKQTEKLHDRYHGELGLSSGYDSRLLLASGSYFLSKPMLVHTHSTSDIHNFERKIAEEITTIKKLPLHIVKTEHIEKKNPEEIESTLLEGLYYFDGRCSYDMGAYSETYTGSYKKKVLGKSMLSFNGLGGEIFRNHFFTSRQDFNTLEWMKSHIYYFYAEEALKGEGEFLEVHSRVISKLGKKLGANISHKMTKLDMRRYYSEVRMPECDGINHNAQNQVAFYLTPFIEPMIVKEAIQATPYIGTHGKYQAEMIRKLDPAIASFQSHYGFSFDSIPARHVIYSIVKGYLPDKLFNIRHQHLRKKGIGQALFNSYSNARNQSRYLKEIEEEFISYFPGFNWKAAMSDSIQKATTVFLASFVKEFSNKIKG